jgi:hypothetical protein
MCHPGGSPGRATCPLGPGICSLQHSASGTHSHTHHIIASCHHRGGRSKPCKLAHQQGPLPRSELAPQHDLQLAPHSQGTTSLPWAPWPKAVLSNVGDSCDHIHHIPALRYVAWKIAVGSIGMLCHAQRMNPTAGLTLGGAAGDLTARFTSSMPLLAAKTLARYSPTIYVHHSKAVFVPVNAAQQGFQVLVAYFALLPLVLRPPTQPPLSAHIASRRDVWVGHNNTACSNVSSAPVLQQEQAGDAACPFWCNCRAVCNISALHNSSALCGAVTGPHRHSCSWLGKHFGSLSMCT